MRLPNGGRAELGTKIDEYALNTSHFEGQHKARVFAAVLGVTRSNSYVLKDALLEAAEHSNDAEFLRI